MVDTLIRPKLREPAASDPTRVPPLENGDYLDSREFMRRYEAMPPDTKAELIDGIVYMASPLKHRSHGKPHAHLAFWICTYVARTPFADAGDNSTVLLNDDDTPQPDLLLRLEHPKLAASDADNEYLEGPPELTVEVAASSASYDLNQKFAMYLRHGVKEYLVMRPDQKLIDWFTFDGNDYGTIEPDADGILKSRVFPGLWLDTKALFDRDLLKLAATVEAGCSTDEHAAFVKRLHDAASQTS